MHCLWADLRVAKRANSMIQKGGDSWRHNVVNVTSHKQGHHGKHSGEILLWAGSDKEKKDYVGTGLNCTGVAQV